MKEFSLRDCLIPELLKLKIDFRILRYKNGDKSLPVSLIVFYKYHNICKVNCDFVRASMSDCYHVEWCSKHMTSFNPNKNYARAFDLVHDIRRAIDFKQDEEIKGENKMDKKKYKVRDIEYRSTADQFDEIILTVDVLRSNSYLKDDWQKIRDAVESIGDTNESHYILCGKGNGKTKMLMNNYHGGFTTWRNEYQKERDKFEIKDVIFNNPATIVFWEDGTKTVVKAENEEFDPEKGLAMAIAKKALGNDYGYYDVFKKYVGRYEKKQKKGGK